MPEKIANIKKKKQQIQKKACIVEWSLVVISLVAVCLSFSFLSNNTNTETIISEIKKETPEERISRHFSAWDGSHYGLTKVIKRSMNDPGSYEHVETVYWDKGGHLIVKTTFRGKNILGDVVKNQVTAEVDLDGNVIEIISLK